MKYVCVKFQHLFSALIADMKCRRNVIRVDPQSSPPSGKSRQFTRQHMLQQVAEERYTPGVRNLEAVFG